MSSLARARCSVVAEELAPVLDDLGRRGSSGCEHSFPIRQIPGRQRRTFVSTRKCVEMGTSWEFVDTPFGACVAVRGFVSKMSENDPKSVKTSGHEPTRRTTEMPSNQHV